VVGVERDFDASHLSGAQRAGWEGRQADQDRTLDAMHRLERALASPAPRREPAWQDEVLSALALLDTAMGEEEENASRPDSLLSDIRRTQPRLRSRVRGVRSQYSQLRDRILVLRRELGEHGEGDDAPDFSDIRQRLAWLLTALRHQRARESDLIYEAYFDAFKIDLGTE
jgi:hypothetical protein